MDRVIEGLFWLVIAIMSFVLGWSLKAWALANKKGAK